MEMLCILERYFERKLLWLNGLDKKKMFGKCKINYYKRAVINDFFLQEIIFQKLNKIEMLWDFFTLCR